MSINEHYRKSYSEDENIEIKCKLIDENVDGYTAVGLRKEDIQIHMSDETKEQNGTEEGLWYNIKGVISSENQYTLELNVNEVEFIGEKVNDWIYTGMVNRISKNTHNAQSSVVSSPSYKSTSSVDSVMRDGGMDMSASSSSEMTEDMSGFATGGGKNIENFRQNVDNSILPHKDSISHEGLLYQYEFDIGSRNKDTLFYPNYEQSIIKDPITNENERYLTVGLDSGMQSFDRPPLDLMFVIDISGSMGHPMDSYYYDNEERGVDVEQKTKIEATKDVLKNVIKKLDDDDRFGITLYNQEGIMAKPLRSVEDTDIDEISSEIDGLCSSGGTNLSDGFTTAVNEMEKYSEVDTEDLSRESRIMFMTDAMPNTGETSKSEIEKNFESAAEKGIHSTFIGIGIDTNPELIDTLSSTRGANHYFIKSVKEFNEKIKDEFNYTVTPLVFDLKLTVEGEGFNIDGVYGSPNEDSGSKGAVMNVKTLFPSHGDEGTKGGVIVVSMSDANIGDKVRISTSWVERDGAKGGDVTKVKIKNEEPTYYESDDTLKAVLLCKYANTISDYLEDTNDDLDSFERESTEIKVPQEHEKSINDFTGYFEEMVVKIDDDELEKELEYLNKILKNT